ncbi:MAG: winged helix-turn-helix transcriptional regulator [Hyphomicrobium sp.]|nr:winged helix-turn-helix transcriptional regulator [Hyphomicrobium sp.]
MVEYSRPRLDGLFRALSHQTRRSIVELLLQRPHSVSELAQHFHISFAATSKHVQVLERAGLIERELRGRTRVAKIDVKVLAFTHTWLSRHRPLWTRLP